MKALLLIDIQNDLLPGGPLGVPDGDAIIPIVNRLQAVFPLVVATQDWHPPDHGSFAASHPGRHVHDQIELDGLAQTLFPVHCVQKTKGAEFAAGLERAHIERFFFRGTNSKIDGHSGVMDNGYRKSTGLAEWLTDQEVFELYICGLDAGGCVKFTAFETRLLGFKTHFIADASRGLGRHPGEMQEAMAEMDQAGIAIVQSAAVLQAMRG